MLCAVATREAVTTVVLIASLMCNKTVMIDHACSHQAVLAIPTKISASNCVRTCMHRRYDISATLLLVLFDDDLWPSYVMQIAVRVCTSAKQEVVGNFRQLN